MNELESSWGQRLVSARTGSVEQLHHGILRIEDAPYLVEYEIDEGIGEAWRREVTARRWSLWRYRELLPVQNFDDRVDLGSGGTPLVRVKSDLGRGGEVWVKEESGNPTGSFKARGLAIAVNRARELGAPGLRLPSAGNAALAAAAYAAAADLPCRVAMPIETPGAIVSRCQLFGAEVILEGQNLTESSRCLAEFADGYWDLSTFKEPYRVEGKKTMAFEIFEQLGWQVPDWIIYPTGGGTGIVAMYKAFEELRRLGLMTGPFPRLVAVQMEGCAPIVQAFESNAKQVQPWQEPTTKVWGLRVPTSIADFLILEALRSTRGMAVSVKEEEIEAMQRRVAASEGMWIGPEGAAAFSGLERLLDRGAVGPDESVVLFQTGHPANYTSE